MAQACTALATLRGHILALIAEIHQGGQVIIHHKDDIGIEHGNVFISHLLPMNPHLDVFIGLGHPQGIVHQPEAGTRTVSAYLAVVREENESFLAAGLGLVFRTGYGFINVFDGFGCLFGHAEYITQKPDVFLGFPQLILGQNIDQVNGGDGGKFLIIILLTS